MVIRDLFRLSEESLAVMTMSELSLKEVWDNKEDEIWNGLITDL